MRYYKSKNWPSLLKDAVELLNARRMTRNGGIPPGQINSYLQDPELRSARELHHVNFPEPSREEEKKSETKFLETEQTIQVGSCVFLDRKAKTFSKSFELQVSGDSVSRVDGRLLVFIKQTFQGFLNTYLFSALGETKCSSLRYELSLRFSLHNLALHSRN